MHWLNLLTGCLFDLPQHVFFARSYEEYRFAVASGSTGTPDAVHIGFGVVRNIVVHHEGDAFNIQSAGGYVGCYENVDAPVAQRIHGAFAQLLRNVAVNSCRLETACLEFIGYFFGFFFGAHEDDNAVVVFDFEHAGHGVKFVGVHDLHVALADVRPGGGLGFDAHLGGVVEVLLGDFADRVGHGG